MKLTLRIYLAVLFSLLLFVVSILLLGWFLGGYEKREYTEEVAEIFEEHVLPRLNLTANATMALDRPLLERRLERHRDKFQRDIPFFSDEDKEHHGDHHAKQRKQWRQQWKNNRDILRAFTREHHASIVILSPQGTPLRRIGRAPQTMGRFTQRLSNNHMVAVAMPHGLTAHIRTHNPNIAIENFALRFLIGLGVLFVCVGLISYPIARRISKRLGKLTDTVNHWGKQGNTQLSMDNALTQGSDEIATLSQSFANASQRIDDLLQANKLLLANASHEIRTPLTRIRLNIEMLENVVDTNKQDDYKKRETAIKRNLAELDALVESILQSSRLDAQDGLVNAKQVDLYTLVQREAEHYPEIKLTGESAQIIGQENLLIQLVRNLIGNAYKHGKPPVSADVATAQGKVVLTVTDGGDGIPVDKLDEIFTPFKRLSNNTKGNGLGLHLVKKIVELHGGEIRVSSRKGETVFIVRLPQH